MAKSHWLIILIVLAGFFRIDDSVFQEELAGMVLDASARRTKLPTDLGGEVREFRWSWKKRPVSVVYEVIGTGHPLLLLPAFSSVSTRLEMAELARLLAAEYQVFVLDWPGFGQSARPAIAYSPAVYRTLLKDFVRSTFEQPVVVIAAGHAAGYVMELAQRQPIPWSWVVLTAPTWRGPFPTAFGDNRWLYDLLYRFIQFPIIGHLLYALNTFPPFLRLMMRRHVFVEPQHITRNLMQQKWRTTQRRGARFASAAFVTGNLDLIRTQEEWLSWFQPLPVPTMIVIGEEMPPRSRAEVEVLAHFSAVQVYRMPGSLGLHEEYPKQLAEGILPFLGKYLS